MDVEYHPKSRIITFLISIVSSAALSGVETDTLVTGDNTGNCVDAEETAGLSVTGFAHFQGPCYFG